MNRRAYLALALVGAAACSSSEPAPRIDAARDAAVSDSAAASSGDGAASSDAPSSSDAGVCAGPFAGCDTFTDATGAAADRTVMFRDFEYTPKCLRVKQGQTVVFKGDFASHPLVQTCGPAPALDSHAGDRFTLTVVGLHGYYCGDHGSNIGQGMSGAIDVVP